MSNERTAKNSSKAIRASAIASVDLAGCLSGLTEESPDRATRLLGIWNDEDQAAESNVCPSGLRVLLVSSPGLFADGFARSLAVLADQVQVLRCHPERITDSRQDVGLVLVDLDCAEGDRADLIGALRAQVVAPLVALTSALDDRSLTSVLEAGVAACLAKTCGEAQALATLRHVLASAGADARPSHAAVYERRASRTAKDAANRDRSLPYGLTPAELRVLNLLCEGLTNLAIANRLGIMEGTVKVHLMRVYQKLGVQSRTQAVQSGQRLDAVRDLQAQRVGDNGCRVEWLLPEIKYESRREGEVLFEREDPADALYYVQKGAVALHELGTEVHEGELLGEVGVFSPQQLRTSSARCAVDTRLFRLTAEQVKRLYFGNPQFAYYLMRVIARRLTADRLSHRG